MPRRSVTSDLTCALDANPVLDKDNVYFSDQGWAYRHYKSADKLEFWDEILVAGQALEDDGTPDATADAFGAASPTFLVGDGQQMPIDRIYVVGITGAGSGYITGTGLATTGGVGSGMTVDITADSGEITDVNIADIGDGLYVDGDELTVVQGGGALGTFTVNVL